MWYDGMSEVIGYFAGMCYGSSEFAVPFVIRKK
jgi:hypothetical protein